MPIDYSKWDHLDGDSESDEDDTNVAGPTVTRLDASSRVTFGGQLQHGWSTSQSPSRYSGSSQSPTRGQVPRCPSTNDAPSKLSPTTRSVNQWTAKGGSCTTTDERNLYWSQDRYSVLIRLELHPGEAIERVHVDGILPYSDRHCATGSDKHHLHITGKMASLPDVSSTPPMFTLLRGDLPHPVHLSQEEESEAHTLDWEIERHPLDFERRFVSITLHKAAPMIGLFVWWKRPLLQFDIAEQNDNDNKMQGNSNDFLEAWKEAHRIFRDSKRPQAPTLPI